MIAVPYVQHVPLPPRSVEQLALQVASHEPLHTGEAGVNDLQDPDTQSLPAAQTLVQLPQCCGSLASSKQS
jgi:hypothetical protein